MSINSVHISGRLTRDAEYRETASGFSVLNFSVAVNDRRKNKASGEWEDYPHFVDCTILGTRAEKLQPYLTKGMKVACAGKLNYSSWETKEGQKRHKLDVVVSEIEFMQARTDKEHTPPVAPAAPMAPASNAQPAQPPTPDLAAAPATYETASFYGEDIPF